MCLQVYKSACSVLAYLGQHEIAKAIMKEGQGLANGSSRAMDFLFISFKAKLPKWIQITKIKIGNKFDWAADIPPGAVFVGVIVSSDGNASHAIAIHGNWIFDSNETKAIPLARKVLTIARVMVIFCPHLSNFTEVCWSITMAQKQKERPG